MIFNSLNNENECRWMQKTVYNITFESLNMTNVQAHHCSKFIKKLFQGWGCSRNFITKPAARIGRISLWWCIGIAATGSTLCPIIKTKKIARTENKITERFILICFFTKFTQCQTGMFLIWKKKMPLYIYYLLQGLWINSILMMITRT